MQTREVDRAAVPDEEPPFRNRKRYVLWRIIRAGNEVLKSDDPRLREMTLPPALAERIMARAVCGIPRDWPFPVDDETYTWAALAVAHCYGR